MAAKSTKPRSEKTRKNKSATAEFFTDMTPAERNFLSIYEKITPQVLKGARESVLTGYLIDLDTIFRTMVTEWPRLRTNMAKLRQNVQELEVAVIPWAEKGEDPDETANAHAKLVESALYKCKPKADEWELDFTQIVGALAEAPERGVGIAEILWQPSTGTVAPRAYKPIPAHFYRWSSYPADKDKLVLTPDGYAGGTESAFPRDKFLIATHPVGFDHPMFGANLTALVGWFGAAKFGLAWFMQYCQLFGTPLRVGKTDGTTEAQEKLFNAMVRFGQSGILVLPDNAEVEIKDATKSGAQLPHLDMLKQADEACDILILGQTLTSSVSDNGGNRALGEVHENTEDKVTLARGKYVADILTQQLVPAILRLNLGTVPEHTPRIVLRGTSDKMSMKKLEWVERVVKIAEVSKEQVYDWLDIPQPEPGAELYQPPAWAQEEADPFGSESMIHAARKKKV